MFVDGSSSCSRSPEPTEESELDDEREVTFDGRPSPSMRFGWLLVRGCCGWKTLERRERMEAAPATEEAFGWLPSFAQGR